MINLAKKDLKENTLIKSLFKLDVKFFFRKYMMIKSIQIEIHYGIRHNQSPVNLEFDYSLKRFSIY